MSDTPPLRMILSRCLLVAAVMGCREPDRFEIETIVHADGSCERSIWQPKGEFLPPEALQPEWNSKWESVTGAPYPPKQPKPGTPVDEQPYIFAKGSFRSPDEIPPHYRYHNKSYPDAGASEIERSYRRVDYGFLVEHRWTEKITNIVTLPKFLEARDQLLEMLIPLTIQVVRQELGEPYDVTELVAYVEKDGRRFCEELAVCFYDAAIRQLPEAEAVELLADVAARFGLNLRDAAGSIVEDAEGKRRLEDFAQQLLLTKLKHRDGRVLTDDEVAALFQKLSGEDYQSEFEKRWESKGKELEDQVGRLMVHMVGVYGMPLQYLFSGPPRFQFTLQVPGQVIETNGVLATADRVDWKFTAGEFFPDGFEMRARSVVFNLEAQREILGKIVIDDGIKADEFVDLVGDEGPLFQAVRAVYETRNLSALEGIKAESDEQRDRAKKLRDILAPKALP